MVGGMDRFCYTKKIIFLFLYPDFRFLEFWITYFHKINLSIVFLTNERGFHLYLLGMVFINIDVSTDLSPTDDLSSLPGRQFWERCVLYLYGLTNFFKEFES
jgi:hypothetical protein